MELVYAALLIVGLYASSYLLPRIVLLPFATGLCIAFPLIVILLQRSKRHRKPARGELKRARTLGVVLVLLLSAIELLVKGDAPRKHALQVLACVIVSNLSLFIPVPNSQLSSEEAAETVSTTSFSEDVRVERVTPTETSSAEILQETTVRQTTSVTGDTTVEATVTTTTLQASAASALSFVADILMRHVKGKEVADNGDGRGEPVTAEQLEMCRALRKRLLDTHLNSFRAANCEQEMLEYLDVDTCRRFLVARGWSFGKALAQLEPTLEWRMKTLPWTWSFKNSPICKGNPYAVNMRMVGLDNHHRPVIYTCFLHANDRHNAEGGIQHLELLCEEVRRVINKLFRADVTKSAEELQWIWVIDFAGFSIRDSSPKTAYLAAKMMAHFPEMLNQAILVEAPHLFSGVFNFINPVLDDRVRSKISFVSLKTLKSKLEERIGLEMADWIVQEGYSIRSHKSSQGKREYWTVQPDGHDAKGALSYVSSPYYIETPGDAWMKQQKASNSM